MYMERHNEDTGQAKLTYALKEGRMVHIDSVENGLKCGCICPYCERDVIARNQGKQRINHFAHAHNSLCPVDKQLMSAYHRLAEQIIADKKQLMLPPGYLGKTFAYKASFSNVEIEQRNDRKDLQPDIVGITEQNERLIIEIYYTHKVDAEKLRKIKELKYTCLEIDVRYTSLDNLENFLLKSSEHRKWLFNPHYKETEIGSQQTRESVSLPVNKISLPNDKPKKETDIVYESNSDSEKPKIENKYLKSGTPEEQHIRELMQKNEYVCKNKTNCDQCKFQYFINNKCRFIEHEFKHKKDYYVLCANTTLYNEFYFKETYLTLQKIKSDYDPLEQYEAKLAIDKHFTLESIIVDFAYSRAKKHIVVWHHDNKTDKFRITLVGYTDKFVFQEVGSYQSNFKALNVFCKCK